MNRIAKNLALKTVSHELTAIFCPPKRVTQIYLNPHPGAQCLSAYTSRKVKSNLPRANQLMTESQFCRIQGNVYVFLLL